MLSVFVQYGYWKPSSSFLVILQQVYNRHGSAHAAACHSWTATTFHGNISDVLLFFFSLIKVYVLLLIMSPLSKGIKGIMIQKCPTYFYTTVRCGSKISAGKPGKFWGWSVSRGIFACEDIVGVAARKEGHELSGWLLCPHLGGCAARPQPQPCSQAEAGPGTGLRWPPFCPAPSHCRLQGKDQARGPFAPLGEVFEQAPLGNNIWHSTIWAWHMHQCPSFTDFTKGTQIKQESQTPWVSGPCWALQASPSK